MELLESTGSRAARDGLCTGLIKLHLEIVEKKRVNHFMDVLGAREVLAVRTPMVMRQRPLKDGTEDRGAHASPIEFLTALDNERMSETLGQWRDFRPLTKEAAIHIG